MYCSIMGKKAGVKDELGAEVFCALLAIQDHSEI